MELIELEKGMILSDCYVVLGVVQKKFKQSKETYKNIISIMTLPYAKA